MPSTLVYLDARPSWIALIAACLMLSGVSKSGSPAPRPITLRPASLSARALSVTAMVADGLMRLSESARKAMSLSPFAPTMGRSIGLLLQCDVLMREPESGKGRTPPEPMKFGDKCHQVAWPARPPRRPSDASGLLKYLVEPRLEVAVVLL